MFHRLFRLRLMPRDVFTRLEELVDVARRNADAIDGLRREMAETADQREIVKRLAAVQDELVRRVMADRRQIAETAAHEEAVTVRLDALARDVGAALAKLDDVLGRAEERSRIGPDAGSARRRG